MRALVAAAVLLAPLPAAAQQVSETTAFLNAVRDRDGGAAGRILGSGGATVLGARNGDGDTALGIAIKRRDTAWVNFLLREGANPDLTSRQGEPPIVTAARLGFSDGVQLLLARGARVDAANRRGETALIAAVQSANTPGAQNALPLVQRLIRAGADPSKTDNAAGKSALDYAREDRRNAAIVRALEGAKESRVGSAVVSSAAPAASRRPTAPTLTDPFNRGATYAAFIRAEDYPEAARLARQQADVDFKLTVGPEGRVTQCTAQAVPPSPLLANTTCRILRSRTRFNPALDASGQPTTGEASGRYSWRLPD